MRDAMEMIQDAMQRVGDASMTVHVVVLSSLCVFLLLTHTVDLWLVKRELDAQKQLDKLE